MSLEDRAKSRLHKAEGDHYTRKSAFDPVASTAFYQGYKDGKPKVQRGGRELSGEMATNGAIPIGKPVVFRDRHVVDRNHKPAPEPERRGAKERGKIKYLYSVIEDSQRVFYVAGWKPGSFKREVGRIPAGYLIGHASVDNLGGENWSVNLSYRVNTGQPWTIEKIDSRGAQKSWKVVGSRPQPLCMGHGFWRWVEENGSSTSKDTNSQSGSLFNSTSVPEVRSSVNNNIILQSYTVKTGGQMVSEQSKVSYSTFGTESAVFDGEITSIEAGTGSSRSSQRSVGVGTVTPIGWRCYERGVNRNITPPLRGSPTDCLLSGGANQPSQVTEDSVTSTFESSSLFSVDRRYIVLPGYVVEKKGSGLGSFAETGKDFEVNKVNAGATMGWGLDGRSRLNPKVALISPKEIRNDPYEITDPQSTYALNPYRVDVFSMEKFSAIGAQTKTKALEEAIIYRLTEIDGKDMAAIAGERDRLTINPTVFDMVLSGKITMTHYQNFKPQKADEQKVWADKKALKEASFYNASYHP